MNGDISFNGNNLQTFNYATRVGIITNLIDHTSIPNKIATLYGIADTNLSAIPSINYPSKTVSISGAIQGSTQADLDSRIDTFKGYFLGKDKNLDISYNGTTRRYIATENSTKITRQQKSLWATFEVEFICTVPFGLDVTPTSIMNAPTQTSQTYNVTPTISGTAPFQLPVFTITVTSKTGAGDFIQISNDNNNQQILILNKGIAAGNVVVIDCVKRKVTINGVEVDYTGTFLELTPGANSITYADGWTTRSVNLQASYQKRYL